MRLDLRQYGPAVRMLVLLTAVLGIGYPLLVTGIGQAAFHSQANGSLIERHGKVVGSSLIGQSFDGMPAYFQSRPSAAGKGYDPLSSGASNLGLDNPDLVKAVQQRQAAARRFDGGTTVAPDAVLSSASGLDPQISPEYAAEQVARVARARGLPEARVRALVATCTSSRTLGFLGEPRVNVLRLDLALDALVHGTLAP